jgi:hypothetical protein
MKTHLKNRNRILFGYGFSFEQVLSIGGNRFEHHGSICDDFPVSVFIV